MRILPPVLIVAILVTAGVPGCRTRDFRTEDDALRARVLEMEREVMRLERRNRELEAELRRVAREVAVPADVAEHTPHVVEIVIDRFSHAIDTTRDGFPDELRVYIQPRDGRGRFVQAVGDLAIIAMILPRDPAAEPIAVGRRAFDPAEVRDAYRSGFMGTHYTFVLPLDPPPLKPAITPADFEQVFIRAVFTDGHTGVTHTAERTVQMRP